MKMQGPVDVELHVAVISDDGKQEGVATIGVGSGRFPTEQDLRDRVAKFETEEMPEGFRLMTKREYFDYLVKERTGSSERLAMPGGPDWDA